MYVQEGGKRIGTLDAVMEFSRLWMVGFGYLAAIDETMINRIRTSGNKWSWWRRCCVATIFHANNGTNKD